MQTGGMGVQFREEPPTIPGNLWKISVRAGGVKSSEIEMIVVQVTVSPGTRIELADGPLRRG
jgi:hypothetical protein